MVIPCTDDIIWTGPPYTGYKVNVLCLLKVRSFEPHFESKEFLLVFDSTRIFLQVEIPAPQPRGIRESHWKKKKAAWAEPNQKIYLCSTFKKNKIFDSIIFF